MMLSYISRLGVNHSGCAVEQYLCTDQMPRSFSSHYNLYLNIYCKTVSRNHSSAYILNITLYINQNYITECIAIPHLSAVLMTMCLLCVGQLRESNAAGAYISAESSCGGAPYNKYLALTSIHLAYLFTVRSTEYLYACQYL
jgi:hypothetical protein